MKTAKIMVALVVVVASGCTVENTDQESLGSKASPLPGTYSAWASVDGREATETRGVVAFSTSASYLRTVHLLNVATDNKLRWQVLDQEGDDYLHATNFHWADVPNQNTGTAILSTSVPSVVRDNTWSYYVYSVNEDNEAQYVVYSITIPGGQTGTWGTWTNLSSLGSFTTANIIADPWCTNATLLLTRESDGQAMYAKSDDCVTWSGPWVMDTVPTGSSGLQMTGADWNGGIQAFVASTTNGKFYVSSYDTSCGTEGASCWDGWTQLPTISPFGTGAKMLNVTTVLNPDDVFDREVCLYAAHQAKRTRESTAGPWNTWERCSTDTVYEDWHSLGTYSTGEDFVNEVVPVAYNEQISGSTPSTRYIYEVNAYPWTIGSTSGVGRSYRVKRAEVAHE